MPYTHCAVCGAKALVGATRCPRCQAPFVSYDPKGERVPTVNCPNCGVQRPVAIGVCPNCLMSTAPSGWRLTRGLILTGLAIGVIVAVGYAISRRTEHTKGTTTAPAVADSTSDADSIRSAGDTVPSALDTAVTTAPATTMGTPTPAPATVAKPSATAASATAPTAVAPAAATVAPKKTAQLPPPTANVATTTAPRPAPPPSVAVLDTGVWEYAVARTSVHVRSAPSITSDILRVIDSTQSVRLGPSNRGWRPIRVGVDRGWVDSRFFRVVPAPKP